MVERLEGRLEKLKNELLEIQQEKELQALEEKRKADEVQRQQEQEKVLRTQAEAKQQQAEKEKKKPEVPPKQQSTQQTIIQPESRYTTTPTRSEFPWLPASANTPIYNREKPQDTLPILPPIQAAPEPLAILNIDGKTVTVPKPNALEKLYIERGAALRRLQELEEPVTSPDLRLLRKKLHSWKPHMNTSEYNSLSDESKGLSYLGTALGSISLLCGYWYAGSKFIENMPDTPLLASASLIATIVGYGASIYVGAAYGGILPALWVEKAHLFEKKNARGNKRELKRRVSELEQQIQQYETRRER